MNQPIKRHVALQPISREHHYGLLLSWKIRDLEFEEKYIYPILGGKENRLVKRALREHGRLKRLFKAQDRVERNLSLIEEELVAHIRFEERILFKEIQKVASETQLKVIENAHTKKIVEDDWDDEFWTQ